MEFITKINNGLKLIQRSDGLTFGSDAYLLSAYVRRQTKASLADLGSGTGIMPLLLLSRKKIANATAYEIQPEFSEIIGKNAKLNSMDNLIAINADIREVNDANEKFDIVISNPPYMKQSGKANESNAKNIARHEICGSIDDFCSAASRMLKFGGLFYTVYRPDRLCDLLCALRQNKLEPKRMTFVHARLELEPCLVLCEAKKNASTGCFATPPLIMYSENSEYTEQLKEIYETGEFNELYQRP